MSQFCPKCGTECTDLQTFCHKCGTSLATPYSEPQQEALANEPSPTAPVTPPVATPPHSVTTEKAPKNYLVESILVTLFCCLPLGIAGIINASQVNSHFAAHQYEEAEKSSRQARKWIVIGFWSGLAFAIIYLLWCVLVGSYSL